MFTPSPIDTASADNIERVIVAAPAHTKAPWTVRTREHLRADDLIDREFYVQTPQGELVILPCRNGNNDEQGANARLIAAAPALLDAAKDIIARWEHGDLAEAVRALAAAIAKAEGRS